MTSSAGGKNGRRHAGGNFAALQAHRAQTLAPPIQMRDALSRKAPAEFQTILANWLAHGRRQFARPGIHFGPSLLAESVPHSRTDDDGNRRQEGPRWESGTSGFFEVAEHFPQESRYVLEALGGVYRNDAIARRQNLSPEARPAVHQAESGPVMEPLRAWCTRQFEDRRVEPNSPLGQAISYLLKHWDKLTLFLRKPGAPWENHLVERALDRAILHRRNALFHRTLNGPRVGDLFMSLIHTCRLNEGNPFDCLTHLQGHAEAGAGRPEHWMPWHYRQTIQETSADTPQ